MKILVLSSEAVPFAKVGGLADVADALPRALRSMGHDVRLVMPRYGRINPARFGLKTIIEEIAVPVDGTSNPARIMEAKLSGHMPTYFVDSGPFFGREGIYGYQDDGERFVFFCRAAMEMLKRLNWQPDVVHCNDWHTGIVPNWLKTIYRSDPFFAATASLFTIHSLQYQGIFGWRVLEVAGLAADGFIYHPQTADLNNVVDLLARGILFADAVNTVSQRYAREIMTSEYGEKLDPILRDRHDRIFGILNGMDEETFDPATDTYLAANFDIDTLSKRDANKSALQRQARLPVESGIPLVGMISRLSDQKGCDILADVIDHVLNLNVQFVLMGTGDPHYHEFFSRMAQLYAEKSAVFLTFDQALAQRIYAGTDIFLMPSRVEPCGLNQMIAMRYGSVPVVRETGGLADTVVDWNPGMGTGNGFVFQAYDRWALFAALVRAIETFRHRDDWLRLQTAGMSTDFSWRKSAQQYLGVYEKAIEWKKTGR
jgi:starch synthase